MKNEGILTGQNMRRSDKKTQKKENTKYKRIVVPYISVSAITVSQKKKCKSMVAS